LLISLGQELEISAVRCNLSRNTFSAGNMIPYHRSALRSLPISFTSKRNITTKAQASQMPHSTSTPMAMHGMVNGKGLTHGSRSTRKESSKTPTIPHPTSVNPIKSKIRDVTRLLERSENLPADVRIEKERALAGYKQDLEKATREKKRQQMITKYHMVRFFERKRATKNLTKLRRQLDITASNDAIVGRLKVEVHDAEVDLNYTMYHPLAEKYISLFPRDETAEARDYTSVDVGKPRKLPMWKIVEDCMETGKLPELRDGKLKSNYSRNESRIKSTGSDTNPQSDKAKNFSQDRIVKKDEDERSGESDGGFFER